VVWRVGGQPLRCGLEGLEQVKAMGGLVIVDRRARLLVEAVPVL
jgi:hypothetical protein